MTRTKKQTHNGDERAALILELFRQLPDKILAAPPRFGIGRRNARGTPRDVPDRRTTARNEASSKSCPRDKYRLSPTHRPRLEGTVDMMLNTGSMYVHVEGMEQQVFSSTRATR